MKTKINEVFINGMKVTIYLNDETSMMGDGYALGCHDSETNTILVKESLNPYQMKHTLIHELTHAVLWCYGFNEWECTTEGMCNFVASNAEFIITLAKDTLAKLEKVK